MTATATATPAQAHTQRWTNGSALTSKLITVGVIAMIACGPLALVVAYGAGVTAAHRPVPVSAGRTLTATQQTTGSFAVGFVAAWLGASQNDSTALSQYVAQLPTTLTQTPFAYRNLAVASIIPGQAGVVSVVIAGDVQDPQTDPTQPASWPRRYFQVAVATHGSTLTALALPAPIAGPTAGHDTPSLDYGVQLPTTDKAGQTVTLFLSAYLTGQGATEPYVSPTTTINAITPTPYAQLAPVSYLADQQPASSPADGAQLQVLATVTLQSTLGQSITTSYALELRARAGRWEIRAIQAAPMLAQPSGSVSTSHSSTTSGTQKGTNG